MGDQDDIAQARFMAFIARKAGSLSWHVSDTHPTIAELKRLDLIGSKRITSRAYAVWCEEFKQKEGVDA